MFKRRNVATAEEEAEEEVMSDGGFHEAQMNNMEMTSVSDEKEYSACWNWADLLCTDLRGVEFQKNVKNSIQRAYGQLLNACLSEQRTECMREKCCGLSEWLLSGYAFKKIK